MPIELQTTKVDHKFPINLAGGNWNSFALTGGLAEFCGATSLKGLELGLYSMLLMSSHVTARQLGGQLVLSLHGLSHLRHMASVPLHVEGECHDLLGQQGAQGSAISIACMCVFLQYANQHSTWLPFCKELDCTIDLCLWWVVVKLWDRPMSNYILTS